jgi:putative transcriptional regulator
MDIKNLREQLGLSQDKLAALLGVAPFTIRRWEKGTNISELAKRQIEALAKEKGVTINE